MCGGLVITLDISPKVFHRGRSDGVPDDLLAAYPRSFVHGEDHLVSSRRMIDLGHPYSHDVNGAEEDVAILLALLDAGEGLRDAVGLHAALVRKHISRLPARRKSSSGLQGFSYRISILTANKKVRSDVPAAEGIANIQREETPEMLVCIMSRVH